MLLEREDSVQPIKNRMYILSQIFAVASCGFYSVTYLAKKKNWIVLLNTLNKLCLGIHFLLLGGFTASLAVFLSILFLITMYIIERFKKEKFSFVVSIIFSILLVPITIFTWQNAFSLFSVVASLLIFVGTAFSNTLCVKLFYLISTILNATYMLIIHSYFGFATSLIILTTAIFGIIKEIKTRKQQKSLAER